MSIPGGGADITDILRQLGTEEIRRVAEEAGLKPRGTPLRLRCPFQGCADKAESARKDTVTVYPGRNKEPRLQCHACGKDGRLIDLLAAVRGWTEAEAIRHLRGLPAPATRPVRLVQPEPPPADDKLKPEEVKSIWDRLSTADERGDDYLIKRGIDDAVRLGLVRFAAGDHPNKRVQNWARTQRLVVALMKDVVGNMRGLQARLVREPVGGEPKIASMKGSSTSKAFFGFPEAIEGAPVVAIAEGLADTCALAQWCTGHQVVVVGAAGKDALPKLAEELKRCDIPVEGRVFALFPQNDRPLNKSRAKFSQLGQLLAREGAHVVMVSTHDEHKDLADWLKSNPDLHWPPAQLAAVLGGDVEHENPSSRMVDPVHGTLPMPERVEVASFGQNFSTLVALLDDPVHREAIMGRRGELGFNEMTGEVDFSGRELQEADVTGIRIRIELHARSPEGRILRFSPQDIWSALAFLAVRRRAHPVRDWLKGLKWDGLPRLEDGVAPAFGLEAPSLEAHLLRKWFIAAAARGISPGCKMHTVLILEGDEGVKKSSFFELMAGPDLYTASPVKIGEADGYAVLRYHWIVEWGELDSMKKARSQHAVMNFISNATDFYRPKYARGQQRIARSCVIVGTTNEKRFLEAGHAHRRYWPIRVSKVDYDWFKANREQLFAEAAHIYWGAAECPACKPLLPESRCPEHRWWLEEDDYAGVLREHNLGFNEADEWTGLIQEYVTKEMPQRLTVYGVLRDIIGKPPGQWLKGVDNNRVVECLKAIGWVRAKERRIDGEVGRFWVPPVHQLELDDPGEG